MSGPPMNGCPIASRQHSWLNCRKASTCSPVGMSSITGVEGHYQKLEDRLRENGVGLDLSERQAYHCGPSAVAMCGQACRIGDTAEVRFIDCIGRRRGYHGRYTLGKWQVHV